MAQGADIGLEEIAIHYNTIGLFGCFYFVGSFTDNYFAHESKGMIQPFMAIFEGKINMSTRNLLPALLIVMVTSSCAVFQRSPKGLSPEDAIVLDTMELELAKQDLLPYRPAPAINIDIHHIELDLRFNWEKQEVLGKAGLTLSAYFHPADSINLDARGFEIGSITLSDGDSTYIPEYVYNQKQLTVLPRKKLRASDTVKVEIAYTARPGNLEVTEGEAIESNQGLYFINPTGEEEGKPRQIWSQGEPECNSGWFPSVDHPHEKFTQEVWLTADTSHVTVSNGRLMYSTINADGTRTDYWKQDLPHSNYLVMIALGEFAEVKDTWKDLDVRYYLDQEYAPHAYDIFGNTPEMLTFYSALLDYPYPWEKFYQIVVRDFVSGAMENTSAVIHGDFVQLTGRQLLDESHEDVIAHELFHHWFGDLVTAETWSQITLNEGFATYGEYLWKEYKYGPEEARLHIFDDLYAYLEEADAPKQLIRYRYQEPDEVFDRHSYEKGGRVLHMLRQEVGDSAFFASIRYYLKFNEFQCVEVDDLRKAFETVCGRDLKWFFDQWYLDKGHPQVAASYLWSEKDRTLTLVLNQQQADGLPVFSFHVPLLTGFADGTVKEQRLWVDESSETIIIPMDAPARWYTLDPRGDMLWELSEEKDTAAWENQALEAAYFVSRFRALAKLVHNKPAFLEWNAEAILDDPFWFIRQNMLDHYAMEAPGEPEAIVAKAQKMAVLDTHSLVRASAFALLDSLAPADSTLDALFLKGLEDPSYAVVRACLSVLLKRNACLASEHAAFLEQEKYGGIKFWLSRIYATCADPARLQYFDSAAAVAHGLDLFLINTDFALFARNTGSEEVYDHLVKSLGNTALRENSWWARYSAIQGLTVAAEFYESRIAELEAAGEIPGPETGKTLARLRNKKATLTALIEEINELNSEEMPAPTR